MILALLSGVFIGAISGLIPGLHSNLIAALLVSLHPPNLGILLIALAVTHLSISIIPSIYLSLPDETTAISLLPGQWLVKEGKGYECVMVHATGVFLSIIILTPLLFFAVPFLPRLQSMVAPITPLLLALALVSFLQKEMFPWRVLLVALAGILGILTMNSNIQEPLLPLLSGLFGVPALVTLSGSSVPHQSVSNYVVTKKTRSMLPLGWLAGSIAGFLPGLGTAHAASIAQLGRKCSPQTMLMLLSSIATANFLFSLVTSVTLGKARNGVVALVMENTSMSLPLYAGTVFAAGGLAYIITYLFAQFFARHAHILTRAAIKPVLLLFIISLVVIISGWKGLLILFIAASIGIIPPLLRMERSILMASLVVPVLIALWP